MVAADAAAVSRSSGAAKILVRVFWRCACLSIHRVPRVVDADMPACVPACVQVAVFTLWSIVASVIFALAGACLPTRAVLSFVRASSWAWASALVRAVHACAGVSASWATAVYARLALLVLLCTVNPSKFYPEVRLVALRYFVSLPAAES